MHLDIVKTFLFNSVCWHDTVTLVVVQLDISSIVQRECHWAGGAVTVFPVEVQCIKCLTSSKLGPI
jgi:hypothetical protein